MHLIRENARTSRGQRRTNEMTKRKLSGQSIILHKTKTDTQASVLTSWFHTYPCISRRQSRIHAGIRIVQLLSRNPPDFARQRWDTRLAMNTEVAQWQDNSTDLQQMNETHTHTLTATHSRKCGVSTCVWFCEESSEMSWRTIMTNKKNNNKVKIQHLDCAHNKLHSKQPSQASGAEQFCHRSVKWLPTYQRTLLRRFYILNVFRLGCHALPRIGLIARAAAV